MRQPTLQEIAAAAIRDIDARRAKKIRRARALAPGIKQAPRRKIIRLEPTVPLAEAFKQWEHELINNPAPVEAPPPHKFYLKLFAVGIVLLVACGFGWAWVRESAVWRNEERVRQHEAFLLQGKALQGQIDKLTQHSERLEEKARILAQYSADLRYSFPGNDGSLLLRQVDQVLADRDRLQREIEDLRQRLAVVRGNLAALNAL